MTDDLYTLFQQTAAAAWLALVAGIWFFKLRDARQIDRWIGMGCVLISPYLLTCYGVHSVNVAENIEAIAQIQQANPVSVEPRAQLAAFVIETKGGNYVRWDDAGGWSVRGAGGGDYGFGDGESGSLSGVLGCSRRELPAAGSTAPENQAAGGGLVSLSSADGTAGSGNWWRPYRSDIALDINRRGDRVVEAINQPAEGIEE